MQPEVVAFMAGIVLIVIKAVHWWIIDNFMEEED